MAIWSVLKRRSLYETQAERNLISRIHWRVLTILGLFYGLIFLNRSNINTSHVYRPQWDIIKTKNDRKLLGITYQVGYSAFEFFTNVILLHSEPKIWLAVVMGMTGILGALVGVPNTFAGVATIRFFLGVFEGAFFPGAIYLLSRWYRRDYLGFPVAVWYAGAADLASFGNFIAAGVVRLNAGREGWQWVSIVEGCITLLLTVLVFWLPSPVEIGDQAMRAIGSTSTDENKSEENISHPMTAPVISTSSVLLAFPQEDDVSVGPTRRKTFFSPEEKLLFDHWITRDEDGSDWTGERWRGVPENKRSNRYWKDSLTDYKTYMFTVVTITGVLPRDLIVAELPTIVSDLRFHGDEDASKKLLVGIPPLVLALVFNMLIGWISDVTRKRGWVNIFCYCFTIIGGIILLASDDPKARYIAAFFVSLGGYSTAANGFAWCCNNFEGYSKRAIVLGISVGSINITSIVTQGTDGSSKARHAMILGFGVLGVIVSYLIHIFLKKENIKKKYAKEHGYDAWNPDSGATEDQGDLSPEFLYYD